MNLAPVSLLLFTCCLLVTNQKPIEGGHLPPPPSSLLLHLSKLAIFGIEYAAALSTFCLLLLAISRTVTVVSAVFLQVLNGIQWLQAHFSALEWVAMIWNGMMVCCRPGLGKTRKAKMVIAIIMGLLLILISTSYVIFQQEIQKQRIEIDDSIAVNWMLHGSNPQHYGFCYGISCPNLWSNHTIGCRLSRFSASYPINSLQGSRLIFVNQMNHKL